MQALKSYFQDDEVEEEEKLHWPLGRKRNFSFIISIIIWTNYKRKIEILYHEFRIHTTKTTTLIIQKLLVLIHFNLNFYFIRILFFFFQLLLVHAIEKKQFCSLYLFI